jgi:hypothetical protein
VLDIRELIRRLQAGDTDRRVARELGLARKTVAKYRAWGEQEGLLSGPLPEAAELQARLERSLPVVPPPRSLSSVDPYRERVVALRRQGVECCHPDAYYPPYRTLIFPPLRLNRQGGEHGACREIV